MTMMAKRHDTRGVVPFRARARLIRLLGEELISNEAMAVTELVKNAYDADARTVTIRVREMPRPQDTIIEVIDDGDGMSLDTVLHAWMEPAGSQKRGTAGKRRTALGRLPLGGKGVGRFACDKLGGELELITRARAGGEEVVLTVTWHAFESDAYLDDVQTDWQVRAPQDFVGEHHGTILRMRRTRAVWDETLLTRVRNGLARLVSPHADRGDFTVVLDCPDLPALHGPVTNALLVGAPHHMNGEVDRDGVLRARWSDGTSQDVDLRLLFPDHFMSGGTLRTPVCGPLSLSLHVWDLDAGGRRVPTTDRATRAALRSSSGVSIYRDGFRVLPYGEQGDDWMELNQRRVNNPTMRVSNNQIVGVVEITQGNNPDLRDRTSREGLVETPAFFDMRMLVLAALSLLEERRFALRRASQPVVAPTRERDAILQWVDRARAQAKDASSVRQALQEMEHVYQQHMQEQETRYAHVVRLAGIGLAAERMTEEFARTLDAATITLRTALNEANTLDTASPLVDHLRTLQDHYELLGEQLSLMAPLYHPSSREMEDLDVRGAVHDVALVLAGRLREAGVRLRITQDRPLVSRINRGHLMQVLMILIDNALDALRPMGAGHQAQVHVHVMTGKGGPALIVADNGPGVRAEVRELIFAPLYASRASGRGLGLHVARDILSGYNATIDLLEQPLLLPGANIVIRFDGRRIRRPVTVPADH